MITLPSKIQEPPDTLKHTGSLVHCRIKLEVLRFPPFPIRIDPALAQELVFDSGEVGPTTGLKDFSKFMNLLQARYAIDNLTTVLTFESSRDYRSDVDMCDILVIDVLIARLCYG